MDMKKVLGIYKIENLKNGRIYIGSSIDIIHRWNHHKSFLRRNAHSNPLLQNSWSVHGETSFEFSVLEEVADRESIYDREQWYLDNVVEWGQDYNLSKYADVHAEGRIMSEEMKRKVSALTLDEELEIQNLYESTNLSAKNISKIYNVSRRTVSRIIKKDLGNGVPEQRELLVPKPDYKEIQNLYMSGDCTQQEIGDMWGVSSAMIGKIIRKDLGGGVPKYPDKTLSEAHKQSIKDSAPREDEHALSKINCDIAREMRRLWKTGKYSQREIGEICGGISQPTVGRVVRYESWLCEDN